MSSVRAHRLAILSHEEVDELYGLPQFTDDDRHTYFDLSPPEQEAVEAHARATGVFLALELGYFKAKRQFFTFEPAEVAEDLRYLLARYFPGKAGAWAKTLPGRTTRVLMRQTVLDLLGYRPWDATALRMLEERARRMAMRSTQPLFLLREILQSIEQERFELPRYSTLQDLVGRVVTHERNRVAGLLDQTLPSAVAQSLDSLLQSDESMYRIPQA